MTEVREKLIQELQQELEGLDPSSLAHLLEEVRALKNLEGKAKSIQRELMRQHKVSSLRPATGRQRHTPVVVKGKPVSEVILEERV